MTHREAQVTVRQIRNMGLACYWDSETEEFVIQRGEPYSYWTREPSDAIATAKAIAEWLIKNA